MKTLKWPDGSLYFQSNISFIVSAGGNLPSSGIETFKSAEAKYVRIKSKNSESGLLSLVVRKASSTSISSFSDPYIMAIREMTLYIGCCLKTDSV